MNDRVFVLREAVVTITQMLAGREIKVTQQGVSAYVDTNADGRPVRVNLPYLPDNATNELCDAVQGFLDHEVAHILESDFSVLKDAHKGGYKNILNMIEDARIEKAMAKRYAGCGHNLAVTGQFFLDKFVVPEMEKAAKKGDANAVIAVLMPALIRSMADQHVYKSFMKDHMKTVAPVYDKIKDLEDKIRDAKSTADCVSLAKEIQARLKSSDSNDGDDGDGESEDKSAGGSGDAKVSVMKKDAGDEEGEKKKGENPEKKEGEKDEEGDSDSSDEEGEGESDGAGDGSDEENEEGEGDGGAGDGSDEEGEGEGSSSESSVEEKSGKDREVKVDDNTAAILEAINKDDANGFDEAMSSVISKGAVDAAKTAPYLIYSKEGDVVEPLPVGRDYRDTMFTSMADKVDHMVGPLQKDLERAISARSLATWEPGRRSGRLHAANLSRLAVGDARVFRRKHETTSKDVAVELVVDASGSMSGFKVHLATQAAYALASVLERINISCEVVAFTTGQPAFEMERLRKEEQKIGRSFTRIESLYMPVIKSFNERLGSETRKRFGWLPNSSILRNNIDGECVEVAARRLMARRESGKVMIVLSDGSPNARGDHYALEKHLEETVKKLEKTGMKIVGIGIADSSVRQFYSKHLVINDVDELPNRVIKELRHLLIG